MARDRKRAKQRRARAAAAAGTGGKGAGTRTPAEATDGLPVGAEEPEVHGQLERADVPGALDHASAEVDEFDATLVRDSGGVPVAPEAPDPISDEPNTLSEGEIETEAELEGYLTEDEVQELHGPSGPGRGGRRGGGGGGRGGGGGGDEGVTPEQASGAPLQKGNRAINFLRASWAELHRVQWPDRRQVTQATAVVLGFVAIAGAYLGLADYVAKEIVEYIL